MDSIYSIHELDYSKQETAEDGMAGLQSKFQT